MTDQTIWAILGPVARRLRGRAGHRGGPPARVTYAVAWRARHWGSSARLDRPAASGAAIEAAVPISDLPPPRMVSSARSGWSSAAPGRGGVAVACVVSERRRRRGRLPGRPRTAAARRVPPATASQCLGVADSLVTPSDVDGAVASRTRPRPAPARSRVAHAARGSTCRPARRGRRAAVLEAACGCVPTGWSPGGRPRLAGASYFEGLADRLRRCRCRCCCSTRRACAAAEVLVERARGAARRKPSTGTGVRCVPSELALLHEVRRATRVARRGDGRHGTRGRAWSTSRLRSARCDGRRSSGVRPERACAECRSPREPRCAGLGAGRVPRPS